MAYKISTGESPNEYFNRINLLTSVTVGDAISAAALSNGEIIGKTVSGQDYQGNTFAPYSSKSPYYHSPLGGNYSRKYRMATTLHFSRYYNVGRAKGGLSIRFENYAAYVLATRGSGVVDLGGAEGRVLGNLEAKSGGVTSRGAEAVNWPLDSNMQPADSWAQGIYDESAGEIASAHNYGLGRMPKREFMNESDGTTEKVVEHIASRIERRVVEINISK